MWERNRLCISPDFQAPCHPAGCSLEPSTAAGPVQPRWTELIPCGSGDIVRTDDNYSDFYSIEGSIVQSLESYPKMEGIVLDSSLLEESISGYLGIIRNVTERH